jgi:TPR repeat protein
MVSKMTHINDLYTQYLETIDEEQLEYAEKIATSIGMENPLLIEYEDAMEYLAHCYMTGRFCDQNIKRAITIFTTLIDAGDSRTVSRISLSSYYTIGIEDSEGSVYEIREVAGLSDDEALTLAYKYLSTFGWFYIDWSSNTNYHYLMGLFHENGWGGCEKNIETAYTYYSEISQGIGDLKCSKRILELVDKGALDNLCDIIEDLGIKNAKMVVEEDAESTRLWESSL